MVIATSCQKDDEPTPTPPVADKYMSTSTGSTWNYELTDKSSGTTITKLYIVTALGTDSTINAKQYRIFSNNGGTGNEYYNVSGNDYYNLRVLPTAFGGGSVENLYLKDNVDAGTSWSQTINVTLGGFPTTATITNTVAAKGLTQTVKNISYDSVTQVTTTINVPLLPTGLTTDIQAYYAPRVGMIRSINKISVNAGGTTTNLDQELNLVTADIK